MQIHLFSIIYLDADEHPDLNLYKHQINHYTNLGIKPENFHIIPGGTGSHDIYLKEFRTINEANNIPNLSLVNKSYDVIEHEKLYRKWRTRIDLNDWVIKCDPDEFYTYGNFNNIQECIKYIEDNEKIGIVGMVVDCISSDNILHEVEYPKSLQTQFPKRTITNLLVGSVCTKVLVNKNTTKLRHGHHGLINKEYGGRPSWLLPYSQGHMMVATINVDEIFNLDDPKLIITNFKALHYKFTGALLRRNKENKHKDIHGAYNKETANMRGLIKNNKLNVPEKYFIA